MDAPTIITIFNWTTTRSTRFENSLRQGSVLHPGRNSTSDPPLHNS